MIGSVVKRQRVGGGCLPTLNAKVGSCSGSLCDTKEKVEPNLIRTQIGWLRLLHFASVCCIQMKAKRKLLRTNLARIVLDLRGCRGNNIPFAK